MSSRGGTKESEKTEIFTVINDYSTDKHGLTVSLLT